MHVKENFNKVWNRKCGKETARSNIQMKEINLFKKENAKLILDMGCGDGTNDLLLAKNGFQVTGLDISEEGLMIAKEKI